MGRSAWQGKVGGKWSARMQPRESDSDSKETLIVL
jgi:hypothetical protein